MSDNNDSSDLQEAISSIKAAQDSLTPSLDLSHLHLETLPNELFTLTSLQSLSLNDTGLTSLPDEISLLKELRSLQINNNSISYLPTSFSNLNNLRGLEAFGNDFQYIPNEILNLPDLQQLNLSGCNIKNIPSKLYEKNITTLWLYNCPIRHLEIIPAFISNLEFLSLANTEISDYSFLLHLKRIKHLAIGNKYLTDLVGMPHLKSLEIFDINHAHNLIEIPDQFKKMPNLQNLTIRESACKKLPDSLGSLNKLKTISIYNCPIEYIPESIGNLNDLSSLYISNTSIKELPSAIGKLALLEQLDLSDNNALIKIPPEISFIKGLNKVNINNCQNLISPPPSVIRGGKDKILAYLENLLADEVQVWTSKLVVVGEGGIGKSCLIDALQGLPFTSNSSTTHGLKLGKLELQHPQEDEKMILNIWDFGGQDIYHATHQFYLTNHSLFILAWSARTGYETGKIYKWLETIHALAPDSLIFIVATNAAPRGADLPKGDIESKYPGKVFFFEVDNSTGLGIEYLKETIRQKAAGLNYMGIGRPNSWIEAAEAIRTCAKRYLTKQELLATFIEKEVDETSYESLAGYLHDMGDLLYYPKEEDLKDTIIIKPEWVSQQIAKVLDSEELSKTAGFLNKDLLRSLWVDIDINLQDKLVTLMEKFDLSYKTKDDKEISLIVEKLKYEEPEQYPAKWAEWQHAKSITFKYQLETIPAGIPTWFIARAHRFSIKIHWRYGALLQDEAQKHLALIIASPERKEVWLHVRGEMPYYFFAQLRDTLELTFGRFKGLGITVSVPCPGHKGKPCTHMFELPHLEKRLTNERPKIDCPKEDEPVDVMQMLFGLSFAPDNLQLMEKMKTEIIAAMEEQKNKQNEELKKLMSLEFVKSYRKTQEIMDSTCPNTFTLKRLNSKLSKIKLSNEYSMQLYCQMPGCNHAVGEPYNVDFPKEWVKRISPYYNGMIKILKLTLPLVVPGSKEYLEDIEIENLKLFVEADEKYTDMATIILDDKWNIGVVESINDEGQIALRIIREILDKVDPHHQWGGLDRVVTPEGHILWLCAEHRKVYKN